MTDAPELLPPHGMQDGHYHLANSDTEIEEKTIGRFYNRYWNIYGGRYSPHDAWRLGYIIIAPARPDDATERARLEGEVARLREALERITRLPLGPDTGSAQWQIDCAVSIAKEALRHDPR